MIQPHSFRMFQFIFLSLLSIIFIYPERCTPQSNGATIKYLLMGEARSSILVYGLSWLYGISGGDI